MAQFFDKIQAASKGGQPPEFFSSHPSPENRTKLVYREVDRLGGNPPGSNTDSGDFRDIKRYAQSRPAAPQSGQLALVPPTSGSSSGRPQLPSSSVQRFENALVRIEHPENWRASGQGDAVTFAPDGGLIADGQGNHALAYGMLINIYEPQHQHYGYDQQRLQPEGYGQGRATALTVEHVTDELIQELRQSNPQLRVIQQHERIRIAGERGLSTVLTNDSPLANTRERNWLVTVLRPEGLLFFVAVAPEADFQDYNSAFGKMLDSARFLGTDSGVTLYPGVTLYADAGFRGKTEVLSNSDPDLRDNAIGNDQVSSIRVPAGYVVTLYSDVNYGGRWVVLRGDESNLSRAALGLGNDELSSIRIERVGTNR